MFIELVEADSRDQLYAEDLYQNIISESDEPGRS